MPDDGFLGVDHDDVVSLEVTELGQATQLTLDCEPPAISGVTVEEVHYWGALLSWETSEEATVTLEWEPQGSNSGESYATQHILWALDLTPCTPHSARILATDRTGNSTSLENAAEWATPGDPSDLPDDALEGADPCDQSTWYEEVGPPDGRGCQCEVGQGTRTGGWALSLLVLLIRRRERN